MKDLKKTTLLVLFTMIVGQMPAMKLYATTPTRQKLTKWIDQDGRVHYSGEKSTVNGEPMKVDYEMDVFGKVHKVPVGGLPVAPTAERQAALRLAPPPPPPPPPARPAAIEQRPSTTTTTTTVVKTVKPKKEESHTLRNVLIGAGVLAVGGYVVHKLASRAAKAEQEVAKLNNIENARAAEQLGFDEGRKWGRVEGKAEAAEQRVSSAGRGSSSRVSSRTAPRIPSAVKNIPREIELTAPGVAPGTTIRTAGVVPASSSQIVGLPRFTSGGHTYVVVRNEALGVTEALLVQDISRPWYLHDWYYTYNRPLVSPWMCSGIGYDAPVIVNIGFGVPTYAAPYTTDFIVERTTTTTWTGAGAPNEIVARNNGQLVGNIPNEIVGRNNGQLAGNIPNEVVGRNNGQFIGNTPNEVVGRNNGQFLGNVPNEIANSSGPGFNAPNHSPPPPLNNTPSAPPSYRPAYEPSPAYEPPAPPSYRPAQPVQSNYSYNSPAQNYSPPTYNAPSNNGCGNNGGGNFFGGGNSNALPLAITGGGAGALGYHALSEDNQAKVEGSVSVALKKGSVLSASKAPAAKGSKVQAQ